MNVQNIEEITTVARYIDTLVEVHKLSSIGEHGKPFKKKVAQILCSDCLTLLYYGEVVVPQNSVTSLNTILDNVIQLLATNTYAQEVLLALLEDPKSTLNAKCDYRKEYPLVTLYNLVEPALEMSIQDYINCINKLTEAIVDDPQTAECSRNAYYGALIDIEYRIQSLKEILAAIQYSPILKISLDIETGSFRTGYGSITNQLILHAMLKLSTRMPGAHMPKELILKRLDSFLDDITDADNNIYDIDNLYIVDWENLFKNYASAENILMGELRKAVRDFIKKPSNNWKTRNFPPKLIAYANKTRCKEEKIVLE